MVVRSYPFHDLNRNLEAMMWSRADTPTRNSLPLRSGETDKFLDPARDPWIGAAFTPPPGVGTSHPMFYNMAVPPSKGDLEAQSPQVETSHVNGGIALSAQVATMAAAMETMMANLQVLRAHLAAQPASRASPQQAQQQGEESCPAPT